MNLLDLLLAAIIVGSIIAGFISGFTRAAFGIIATVVGVILGFWFYETPAGWIEGLVGSHMVANMFGFLIVFFIVLVIGGLIGRMVSGVFKVTGLGFLDRLAGCRLRFRAWTLRRSRRRRRAGRRDAPPRAQLDAWIGPCCPTPWEPPTWHRPSLRKPCAIPYPPA